jgi:hypothetical protein
MTAYSATVYADVAALFGEMTPAPATGFSVDLYGAMAPAPAAAFTVSAATLFGALSLGGASTFTLYHLRGWYVAGSAYEYWSAVSPLTAPPSGHTLSDTVILWIG